MCEIIQINYTSFGITGQSTLLVPGINYNGTYYEYYFNTSYFSGTFQTAIWRIKRNPAIPRWELDVFVANNWLPAKGIAPDSLCPIGPWTTPGTEIIDIIEISEYTLEPNCIVWTQGPISNLGCCTQLEDAIFYINSQYEDLLHAGQYLEDFYNPPANPAPTSPNEYQGLRILALVYLKNNCISFNKCDGGTFLGVILLDSEGNIFRNNLFNTLTFTYTPLEIKTFTWDGVTYLNCRKYYTFQSDWLGNLGNYRIYWLPDVSGFVDFEAPVGTPGWVFETENIPGQWELLGCLPTQSFFPIGEYLVKFDVLETKIIMSSPLPSGVFCVCEKPEPVDNCFELLVWEKQCEFAKCVLKYVQALNFGNANCETLENLKVEKRTLEVLNNYDSRDIPNDTMDYNNISYSDIKKLLN